MELYLSLFAFALVASITPGPNNFMVLASGANWGFWPTLPHILGIVVGFPLMVIAVGLGLGPLFESYPVLHQGLKIAAFVYLLYLAWRIATAGRHDAEKGSNGRPLSFLAALAFQWVNPKAWAMALGSVPLFTTPEGDHVLEIGRLAVIFAIVTLPCVAAWCLFGNAISGLLHDETRLRWFNIGMAVLLVASVVPTLF